MVNKFLKLITTSTVFAFFYIAAFIGVIFIAIMTNGKELWVNTAWYMLSLLGIFVTITGFHSIHQAYDSRRWPKTVAQLTNYWIRESHGSGNNIYYSPMVEYEYSIDGIKFRGDCIDFSGKSGGKKWAQKTIDNIVRDRKQIAIHYCPDYPAVSVIYPGVRFVHYLRLIIGPGMFMFGLLSSLGVITFAR